MNPTRALTAAIALCDLFITAVRTQQAAARKADLAAFGRFAAAPTRKTDDPTHDRLVCVAMERNERWTA